MTTHLVPSTVVELGRGAELVVIEGDRVTPWDVSGFVLCAPPDVEEREEGHARLFLLEGDLEDFEDLKGNATAARTYEMWNQRGAEFKGYMKTSKRLDAHMGRALRLDYDSDKWNNRGEVEGYTHDFTHGGRPPLVWADSETAPEAFVLVGGDMAVNARGIV